MAEPVRLVLATANPGKIRELADLLAADVEVEPRPPDLPETVENGKTLLENATKKALEVFVNTGVMAIADDTGLFVEALGGRPGVRSARYAGPAVDDGANRTKLLAELADVGNLPEQRRAYFETVVAIVGAPTDTAGANAADGSSAATSDAVGTLVPLIGRGRVHGHIVAEPRGAGGFGYDAVFQPDEGDGRTFGEMGLAEKQAISHRSKALAQVAVLLGR